MTMIVTTRQTTAEQPSEIEMMLPWYVTGTLNRFEMQHVQAMLAHDPALARKRAAIQEEYNESIVLHDELGTPSPRALHQLFAAIEAEPPRPRETPGLFARVMAGLSPRLLAVTAAGLMLVLVAQAIVIGWKMF